MKLFDSHCHLQDSRIAADAGNVVERALNKGVTGLLCCGSETNDWEDVLRLARRFPSVIPSFGIHPWYIHEVPPNWQEILKKYLLQVPSAVGEIGLDQKFTANPMDLQEYFLIEQLRLAEELQRPVSIHCVKAWHILTPILEDFKNAAIGIQLHSYNGGSEMVDKLANLGCYFSFSGSLTRLKNKKAHSALRRIPPDRLLLETDAPDIPPEINGKIDFSVPTEPAGLFYVLRFAADLLNMDIEDLADRVWQNSMTFLGQIGKKIQPDIHFNSSDE